MSTRGLLTKNDIFLRRTEGVGVVSQEDALAWGLVGPIARAAGSDYDVRKYFPYTGYETYVFDVPTATEGDVFARYRVRMQEMRESVKLSRQAIERITPSGAWACDDTRVVPPPKDKVYAEMEALIQHFLIYSQGFTVPAGDAYVPVEGPRGEHGTYVVSDGTNRPWRVKMRAPSFMAIQALPTLVQGGLIAGRGGRHRLQRCRDGRLRPVSFHPLMEYAPAKFHKSERQLAEPGGDFTYTPEHQAKFDANVKRYPAEQRKSAILYALYLAQHQQGYLTAAAMSHVAQQIGCTASEVEDVVSYYTMFLTRPVGTYVLNVCRTLSCALRGAERVTEELSATLGIKPGETGFHRHVHADRGRMSERLRSRAGRDGQRRLA